VPVYDSLERAVRCLEALAEFGEVRNRPQDEPAQAGPRQAALERVLATCRRENRAAVLEPEARQVLAEAGVAMGPAHLAANKSAAVAAFKAMDGAPVALKIVSRDILHKSEANGVKLNLADEDAVAQAFEQIVSNGRSYAPSADIAGVLVTPMAAKGGVEVIIGVVRDPTYGPVMMFGLGGVLVEVLKDVVFRALPLNERAARSMLEDIRAREILNGVRGAPPVDKDALIELMLHISSLCMAFPEISELDLNPVLAYPRGINVLDARILVRGSDMAPLVGEGN
jgi:acetyltransferase